MTAYYLSGSGVISKQRKIQHLLLRAGFGETPAAVHNAMKMEEGDLVNNLFRDSVDFRDIDYLPYPLKENQEERGVNGVQFLKMVLKSRKDTEELNVQWLFKMANTKAVLREKMTFFWHNHFSTAVPFAYLMQVQNNTLRKYALGSFRDLLFAVTKDPAMILYLNNQQNKKGHPNENFARELMELFTLGTGHYSEQDIREAARAFTGWAINGKGEFIFNAYQHDDGEKVFLGRKGFFNGEDILNILLEEKQTAVFIVTKIYRDFVNPVPDKGRISELADSFFDSGYDIQKLMHTVFSSAWFYDEENIGVKIASPVELLVRYYKLVSLRFRKEKPLLQLQRALGQVLFFPPNVAGWKGGESWIDSTSLVIRLSLPAYMLEGTPLSLKSKPAFESSGDEEELNASNDRVESDWESLAGFFSGRTETETLEAMLNAFIQCDQSSVNKPRLLARIKGTGQRDLMYLAADIFTLPEFQLI